MMKSIRCKCLLFLMVAGSLTANSLAQSSPRSASDQKYSWDLTEIYPSVDAWKQDKDVLLKKANKFEGYKGRLMESPESLLGGLRAYEDFVRQMQKLFLFPRFHLDLDQRNQEYAALLNEFMAFYTGLTEVISFLEPEILKADAGTVRRYIQEEPALEAFDFYLLDLFRVQEHVLSDREERLLGFLSIANRNSDDIHGTLLYSDMPYPEVRMSHGDTVVMDRSTLYRYLESENRTDRKLAMESYWEVLNGYRNTFGQLLIHKLNNENMIRQARNYESNLEMALDEVSVPEEIYHTLIENTHRYMDAHHRYWRIKKRMLGLDTLQMYDLVAPVVRDISLEFTYEEAQELILGALKPLGSDYQSTVRHAFDHRWIDVYPATGKRVGAYNQGTLTLEHHPFILTNFQGFYSDVSTLAHELGHAMHDYYAAGSQSFVESQYPLFIAEVPSTLNSILLVHSMLNRDLDVNTRLALLMNYLDQFIATIFRQVMYAEFELQINRKIESGESLTAGIISDVFGELSREYYGHDEGIIDVDEDYFGKWSVIGHFYGYSYYVYVYSTSFLASVSLADRILSGEEGAAGRFLGMISAGGSDYPVELLRQAGVDLTTSGPFENAMKTMHLLMDEVEEILDSME
jgi:oligoendopeptidase F